MKRREPGYTDGQRLEVTVERIIPGGAGLARGPAGTILIQRAVPGDRLEIEIVSRRGGVARGEIRSIVEPSLSRVAAPCDWYGRCGGCDFQHLSYEAQLQAKVGIVADALTRIGQIDWPGPIDRYGAPRPFGSRARVELHADSKTGAIGFFERRSNQIVDVERCIVSSPEVNHGIETIRAGAPPHPRSIRILGGEGQVRSAPAVNTLTSDPFWLAVRGIDYLLDPAGFFQSTLDLLPELIDRVVESGDAGRHLAWDLYCGTGLFSLPLAGSFDEVVGVEVDPRSIAHASRAAARNSVGNARFVASDVARWNGQRRQRSAKPDLIVVDPPRTGLGIELSSRLAARTPQRITYVSCDPTTLVRDLKVLLEGNLRIADIAIFDLFPQTHHVETVVRLASGTGR